MNDKKKLSIEFKINLKYFIPEFSIRILYLLVCILLLKANYKPSESANSFLIALLFIFFNVVISALTFYRTYRSKSTIVNFFKMRIKSHKKYNDLEINKKIDYSIYYIFALLATLLFCGSTICILFVLDLVSLSDRSVLIPIFFFIILPLNLFIFSRCKTNFISSEIKSISVEGKKLSIGEINSIKDYFRKKNENQKNIYYENDSFLYELEEKSNIYKHRVETLLIEAVFIGALTFGTFIQLTSPESITTFDNIQQKENKLGFEKENFFKIQRDRYRKIVYEIVYNKNLKSTNDLNAEEIKSIDNLIKVIKDESDFNDKKTHKTKVGFFTSWSRERQQTILSWLLKKFDNKRNANGINDVFDLKTIQSTKKIILKDIEEISDSDLKLALVDSKNKLILKYDSLKNLINQKINNYQVKLIAPQYKLTSIDSIKKNYPHTLYQIVLIKDQLELIRLIESNDFYNNKNPYLLAKPKLAKALLILHFHNKEKFKKLYNITKEKWDELEYYFFISIGSIICSVLYISVLILRFPIILSIENLLTNIKKANMWNQREENMLDKYYDFKIQNSKQEISVNIENNHILNEFNNHREKYTERFQIQLSKCEIISSKIETKIQIISFLRNFGLYTFFGVVLISTSMIEPKFSLFLLSILVYTTFISRKTLGNKSLKEFWLNIKNWPDSNTKDQDENEIIDAI